jgi:hypothetical protein
MTENRILRAISGGSQPYSDWFRQLKEAFVALRLSYSLRVLWQEFACGGFPNRRRCPNALATRMSMNPTTHSK